MSEICKLKHGWKVVKVVDGKFESAVGMGDIVNYSKRGWISSKGANPFLFVFSSRDKARSFMAGRPKSNKYAILKVEVRNPRLVAIGRLNRKFVANDGNWPVGTFFADAVKVVPTYAFKVVRVSPQHNLRSAISRFSDARRAVTYQLGKVTRPKPKYNPFLFVFKNEGLARSFRSHQPYGEFEIYKCEITEPRISDVSKSGQHFHVKNFPKGTQFCSSVKLIERLRN